MYQLTHEGILRNHTVILGFGRRWRLRSLKRSLKTLENGMPLEPTFRQVESLSGRHLPCRAFVSVSFAYTVDGGVHRRREGEKAYRHKHFNGNPIESIRCGDGLTKAFRVYKLTMFFPKVSFQVLSPI